MLSWWRSKARPIIATVLAANAGKDERTIRRALRVAYPFGPRLHHPYKIWCDEIRIQRGRKKIKVRELQLPDERQRELFNL